VWLGKELGPKGGETRKKNKKNEEKWRMSRWFKKEKKRRGGGGGGGGGGRMLDLCSWTKDLSLTRERHRMKTLQAGTWLRSN